MAQLLQPGFYSAKIIDYGVKKTSKGDPAPTIAFEVLDSAGATHKVFWQGSFNGRAIDFTLEALLVCGLTDPTKLSLLANQKASGLLDLEKTFEVDVSIEVNQNDPSKKYNRINWINESGATKFKDAITAQEFSPEIERLNLVGELMRIAQEKGYKLGDRVAEIPF